MKESYMRVIFASFILLCMLIMLPSCSVYKYFQQKTQKINECHHACQDKLRHCLSICHNDRYNCSSAAHALAQRRYKRYLHEQSLKGQDQILELNSFRDPLQCRKTSCECLADVRVCRQFCNGTIRKRLQVATLPC